MKEKLIRELSDSCTIKTKEPSEFAYITVTEIDTESTEPCYKFKLEHSWNYENRIIVFDLEDKDKLIDLKNKIVNLVEQFE